MIGLPEHGALVKIFPRPGMAVQATEAAVDGGDPLHLNGQHIAPAGGRFLKEEGELVVWSPWYHEQYKSGSIMLHPPHAKELAALKAAKAAPPAKRATFDPKAAATKHMHDQMGEEKYTALDAPKKTDEPAAPPPAPAPTPAK